MSVASVMRSLKELPNRVKDASLDAAGDWDLVDLVGEIKSMNRRLRPITRGIETEIEGNVEGRKWEITQSRSAKRTYNTNKLLGRIADLNDWSLVATISNLLRLDVIRISWQWTNLSEFAAKYDLPLNIAKHEIEDGDPEFDIGEVWDWGYPRYEAV